jgi:alpha-beta hydrolase superfamily lysophospholipase
MPPEPRRVFVLVHGFGEHSGRYEHVGAWFAARHCAAHAFDLRGHGRSQGVRCHVRRFDELVEDLDRILARARAEHSHLPHFLLGHSMGGLVVAIYARKQRPDLAGVAISGAALSIAEGVSAMRARAVRLLRRVAPRYALESGLDPEGLSTDPEVVRAYREDPLVQTRMTASLAVEFFDASRHGAAGGSQITLPALVLHGGDDPICSPRASEAFARAVPDAQLRIYPGMRHEIFNEPEYESVLQDILAWARDPHSGSGGPTI